MIGLQSVITEPEGGELPDTHELWKDTERALYQELLAEAWASPPGPVSIGP